MIFIVISSNTVRIFGSGGFGLGLLPLLLDEPIESFLAIILFLLYYFRKCLALFSNLNGLMIYLLVILDLLF